jgi:hypothetical protein
VERSRAEAAAADITVRVVDASKALTADDRALLASRPEDEAVCVLNKCDLEERLTVADRALIERLPYPAQSMSSRPSLARSTTSRCWIESSPSSVWGSKRIDMSPGPPSTSLRFDVIVVGAGHAGIEAA